MNKDQGGRPTEEDNKEQGRATPQQNDQENQEIAEKYTDGDNPGDNVRQMNPNRNVDKDDATNAGGYKN